MRPALYQATHPMLTVFEPKSESTKVYDIVGPICESTDTFARSYPLSGQLRAGELMVFLYTGAYCSVMNSAYNSRTIIPEIMINGSEAKIIRQPIDQEVMMAFEQNVESLTLA
jgi:diaminopimelate decarboxylase